MKQGMGKQLAGCFKNLTSKRHDLDDDRCSKSTVQTGNSNSIATAAAVAACDERPGQRVLVFVAVGLLPSFVQK